MQKQKKIQRFLKRAMDILGSGAGLIILSPVILVTAHKISKEMGKPVFFNRLRAGQNGKSFNFYKFRTMTDAKDNEGNLLPDAERLTELGKKIRSSSIDELPQL